MSRFFAVLVLALVVAATVRRAGVVTADVEGAAVHVGGGVGAGHRRDGLGEACAAGRRSRPRG